MQELKDILLSQAQDLGANLCGVADLTTDSQWIRENYGDLCASFPRAVSIAIFFPREIIQEQAVGPTRSYSYFYAAINRQLDSIGFRLSNFLQQKGFRSYPIPTSDYRQTHLVPGLQEQVAVKGTEGFEKMQTELMGMFSHRFCRQPRWAWVDWQKLPSDQSSGGSTSSLDHHSYQRTSSAGSADFQPLRRLYPLPGCLPYPCNRRYSFPAGNAAC